MARKTKEQQKRSDAARKGWATRAHNKRSAAARKGWETRRKDAVKTPPAPPAKTPPRHAIKPEKYREILSEWDEFDREDWDDRPDESE